MIKNMVMEAGVPCYEAPVASAPRMYAAFGIYLFKAASALNYVSNSALKAPAKTNGTCSL
jgi:hypothetical protein